MLYPRRVKGAHAPQRRGCRGSYTGWQSRQSGGQEGSCRPVPLTTQWWEASLLRAMPLSLEHWARAVGGWLQPARLGTRPWPSLRPRPAAPGDGQAGRVPPPACSPEKASALGTCKAHKPGCLLSRLPASHTAKSLVPMSGQRQWLSRTPPALAGARPSSRPGPACTMILGLAPL